MSALSPKPTLSREERRGNRQARRTKQREGNAGRAAKMHVARLAWEGEARQLRTQTARPSLPQVLVGCSGWFYWHWCGGFYPDDLPSSRWFDHYAKHFKTVELNAPFYSWPTTAALHTWIRQAGRRKFIYTVKAWNSLPTSNGSLGRRRWCATSATSPTSSARAWGACFSNFRPASTTQAPAWIESYPNSIRPGAASWSFDTAVGGRRACSPPSARPVPSSARAADRGCRTSW